METPEAVIDFWFEKHGDKDWWEANPAFDREIAKRFGETHARLALGEGFSWRGNAPGRLAEIIVLDQFSRQLYHHDPRAFAQDGMAVVLAQEAIAARHDLALRPARRMFLYMPLLHSESVLIHEAAQPLFAELGDESFVRSAMAHFDCVRRFGRFPKRNAALGRASTPDEIGYLAEIGDRMF